MLKFLLYGLLASYIFEFLFDKIPFLYKLKAKYYWRTEVGMWIRDKRESLWSFIKFDLFHWNIPRDWWAAHVKEPYMESHLRVKVNEFQRYLARKIFGWGHVIFLMDGRRHWIDRTELIAMGMVQCLYDYVEGEEGLKSLEKYPEYIAKASNEHEKQSLIYQYGWMQELKNIYHYFKVDHPRLEEEIQNRWSAFHRNEDEHFSDGGRFYRTEDGLYAMRGIPEHMRDTFDSIYADEQALEAQYDEYLAQLVRLRHHLWT